MEKKSLKWNLSSVTGVQRGKSQYLVKWVSWPLSESTWEDEKQLTHCDSALKHFHEEAGRRSSVKRGAV
jgi:Chromo (CHRromatin Organisation MOdifier) domain